METKTRPGRVVDAEFYGWWGVGDEGYVSQRDRTPRLYDDVVAEYGPVRPVVPAPRDDVEALRGALIDAKRKAVTSLLAALGQTWQARMTRPAPGEDQDWELPMRALTAGRPGSWEAVALQEATGFGRDLLLGSPKRVDAVALEVIAGILWRWMDGPQYVELAETLPAVVAGIADEHGKDGWEVLADQWLQPASMAHDGFVTCYRWLYSTSAHFNADVL